MCPQCLRREDEIVIVRLHTRGAVGLVDLGFCLGLDLGQIRLRGLLEWSALLPPPVSASSDFPLPPPSVVHVRASPFLFLLVQNDMTSMRISSGPLPYFKRQQPWLPTVIVWLPCLLPMSSTRVLRTTRCGDSLAFRQSPLSPLGPPVVEELHTSSALHTLAFKVPTVRHCVIS